MKYLPVILLALLLCSWGCKDRSKAVKSADTLDPDTSEISIERVNDTHTTVDISYDEYGAKVNNDEDTTDVEGFKSLNDIRFENWTEKDWLDNDYIRTVRKYLDSYLNGDIEDVELDPYREYLASKFGINYIYPSYGGGVNIRIIFLDMPDKIFDCWVYSSVDREEEKILGYHVKYIKLDEEGLEYSKEEMLKTFNEHPEFKLW